MRDLFVPIVVILLALMVLYMANAPRAAQPWKSSCVNGDPAPLVQQLNQTGATEVIVLDRPHGQTSMTVSTRICILFR